jgi:hypothetical protein
MPNVIRLHPSVRERHEPSISAAALAEYLIMTPDHQETVLQNSRFLSPIPIVPHSSALTAIREYSSDPRRSKSILEAAKEALRLRSINNSITPHQQEESRRCIETIGLFEIAENIFGVRGLNIQRSQKFAPVAVEGVLVSAQPDLLIRTKAKEADRVGVVMFRPQKAPDPAACRLETTKRERGDHRREMGRYMLAIADMTFERSGAALGRMDRDTSVVADIRMGERIAFSTDDHAARVRAIKAACRQIKTLWDSIQPKKSSLAKG